MGGATGGVPRWLAVVGIVVAGLWTVGVVVAVQVAGWVVEQAALVSESRLPWWVWPLAGAVGAVLCGVPALLIRLLSRRPTGRAIGTAWLASAGLLAAFSPIRALGNGHLLGLDDPGSPGTPAPRLALTALVAATVVAAVALARRLSRLPAPPGAPGAGGPGAGGSGTSGSGTSGSGVSGSGAGGARVLLAFAGGVLVLVPWLWVGALGSVTDTVCAVLAAAGVGAVAGTVLGARWWSAFDAQPSWLRLLAGGAAVGVALVPIAGGVGAGGVQLLLLVAVPPLALAIAALSGPPLAAGSTAGGAGRVGGVLVGVGVAGPLGVVDPAEVTVLLADTVWWVARGAVLAAGLGLLVGAGYGVVLVWRRVRVRWVVAAGVAAGAVLAAAVVYPAAGTVGWYGDRLFVVLRAKADLAGVAALGDRDRRAREVYRRLVATADASQRGLRAALRGRGLGFTPYYLVNAIEVDSDSPVVRRWLAGRSDVAAVLDSPRLRPLPATPAAGGGQALDGQVPWNLAAIGADRVASELHVDGHGVVVGSSDSGVDGRHPALRGGFRGGDDSWYDPWYGSRTPVDYQGHGTHTTASAVGAGVGVAPGARWVACVNLARDTGSPARYLDCWQFMLAPFPPGGNAFTGGDPARGPEVLTNSWGCAAVEGCDAGVLRPAVDAFAAAGTFVVVAAGNTGPGCGTVTDPPAAYPDALTVGATGRDGRVAGFSSRGGGKPDVVAPGSDVLSALPGGGYGRLDGTSMATPQVAGVVALMWSANPRLVGDLATTTAILRSTATPVAGGGSCGAAGAGQVDAYAAVRAALKVAK